MFQSILVPLDGSVFAEHALPMAISLARHAGCPLRLVRVVPPLADYFFWAPMPGDPLELEMRELHRHDAQVYLDDVVRRLHESGAGRITCDVVEETESVTESICADVVNTGADLVVLTSHGRGAMARIWLGSIADQLVRSLSVPVLLVRPHEPAGAPNLKREMILKHLVLALNGTPEAELILQPALAIGKAMGSDYTLVRAIRPAWPMSHPIKAANSGHVPSLTREGAHQIDERQRRSAAAYLETVAARLRADGAIVHTHVNFAEQPAASILHEAVRVGADLIALETHGRGDLSRLFLGSVADKVVRGSSLPVLVCRLPTTAP